MDIQFRADGMPMDKKMRVVLAQREDAPQDVLRILASEEKLLVAGNPSCPLDLLAGFAQDPDLDMRLAVAGNPSCPSEILAGLANDPSDEVRLVIALRPYFSAEGLARLALDQSRCERERERSVHTRKSPRSAPFLSIRGAFRARARLRKQRAKHGRAESLLPARCSCRVGARC